MIVITCLDDKGGMMFHHRRQSQDRKLREYIREMTGNSMVYMNAYSADLYQEIVNPVISENFLDLAEDGEYCIVENCELSKYQSKIERVIVFRWNKIYPADFKMDLDLGEWKLCEQTEIKGSSHEILKEVYQKNGCMYPKKN
jgi:hypothetical protein